MTAPLTPEQIAEAHGHAERMLRGWSERALRWSQLGNVARIAMAYLDLVERLAEKVARVDELLAANTREVERRREAEAERDVAKAADRATRDEFIAAWKAKESYRSVAGLGVKLAGLASALASDVQRAFGFEDEAAMRAFGNNGPGHLAREVSAVARELCAASDRASDQRGPTQKCKRCDGTAYVGLEECPDCGCTGFVDGPPCDPCAEKA